MFQDDSSVFTGSNGWPPLDGRLWSGRVRTIVGRVVAYLSMCALKRVTLKSAKRTVGDASINAQRTCQRVLFHRPSSLRED